MVYAHVILSSILVLPGWPPLISVVHQYNYRKLYAALFSDTAQGGRGKFLRVVNRRTNELRWTSWAGSDVGVDCQWQWIVQLQCPWTTALVTILTLSGRGLTMISTRPRRRTRHTQKTRCSGMTPRWSLRTRCRKARLCLHRDAPMPQAVTPRAAMSSTTLLCLLSPAPASLCAP